MAYILLFNKSVKKIAPEAYGWFKYGIFLKFIFCILVEVIYLYYYKYGDSLVYFGEGSRIVHKIINNPFDILRILSLTPTEYIQTFPDLVALNKYGAAYYNDSTVRMIKITGFLSLFSFNNIFGTAMLFGALCHTGLWYTYKIFIYHLPNINKKKLFAAVFLLPSVLFWGGGILKEPIGIFLLSIIFYHLHKLLIRRKINILSIIISITLSGMLLNLKSYYFYALMPAFGMFFIFHYANMIKVNSIRKLLKLGLIGLIGLLIVSIPIIITTLGIDESLFGSTLDYLIRYNENLSKGSGSVYNLSIESADIAGLLKVAPQAIFVTLFRPFIWESGKIIILINAIESSFVILFTLYFLVKVKLFKPIQLIFKHPILLFCLIFTLIFALITGASSGNFGALVRYKIPCIPYFLAFMYLCIHIVKNQNLDKEQLQKTL